jgi:hypothetical protein
VAFTKALTICQLCHSWVHTLCHSPGIVLTGLTFPFTYMCTQYLHHILLPTPFPYPPSSHWYQSPKQDLLCLLLSDFVKEKKWHFCLFKVTLQEVSLWHFYVHMYYNLNWFISIFLLST